MVPNWREGIPCVLCGAIPPGGLPYRGMSDSHGNAEQVYLCDDCGDRVDDDEDLMDLVVARSQAVNAMLVDVAEATRRPGDRPE